jgi:transposase
MSEGGRSAVKVDEDVVGSSRVREFEARPRDLARLLGHKTLEVEILKEAMAAAREKPSWQSPSAAGGFR